MKRRSFLALLGLAPAAMALPSVALAVPEAECSPSAVNNAVRAVMATVAAGWRYDDAASVWIHADGRFVSDERLVLARLVSPDDYFRQTGVAVSRVAGDYTILTDGTAMHRDFPERRTLAGVDTKGRVIAVSDSGLADFLSRGRA